MIYINNGEHDNPHELPKENIEGSLDTIYTDHTDANFITKLPEEIEKLEYTYQHFQDREKIYETNLQVTTEQTDDTLYPQINNHIEYGPFKNVIDSYYLDSQIRDDFTCTKACYTHNTTASTPNTNPQYTLHMIIFHSNWIHYLMQSSNKCCTQMKQTHHYLQQILPHSVHLTQLL